MTQVNIPGVGMIDFGDMADSDIESAISKNLPAWQGLPSAASSTGVPSYDPANAPATEKAKGELYGNDFSGAAASFGSRFVGDIPLVGPPAEGGIERGVAGAKSVASGQPYGAELKNVQDYVQKAQTEHPTAGTAGSVAGNVAATGALAITAPELLGLSTEGTLLGNTAKAAITGGVAEGGTALEQGESLPEAGTQALSGAATFAATPVVGRTVGALVSKLADKAASLSGPLSDQDQRALGWAVTNLQKSNITSDADIDHLFNELGPHAFLAEYGKPLTGLADAMHAAGGQPMTDITNAIDARTAEARQRIDDAVTEALGPRINVYNLTQQGIMDRSDAARDLYDQWRTQTIHPTDEIKALYPRLNAVNAFGEARAKAAADGVPFDQNFFTTGEQKAYPTAQSWDYVKQALDDKISASKNPLTGENTGWTRIYTGIKNDLMNAIDNSNGPGAEIWKEARKAWADPTAIMRARNEGQLAFQRGTRRDDMLAQLSDYSQPERNAYKEGARDEVSEAMDNSVRGDTNARNMLLAPAARDKLNYLATNKNYNSQTLIDKLEQERSMADFAKTIQGGSQTTARLAGVAQITPNPEDLLISRIRAGYAPHVMPGSYLPKALENAAAARQAQQFEQSREAAAPMLMKQGQGASDFAKALLAHQSAVTPGTQYGPAVEQYVQLLARGLAPGATNTVSPYAQHFVSPNQ
jgi:hypothetical protein